ncbi:hypothetical protein [Streptomyces eurocidicus]|uniref:Uncharacterized protein n=1 Tax=Streptomyces eurocidicus TaxID=66423 RepID=A0A7W8BG39_STREU|nr:hypothetical protein [Streptomyces eurocidicus]MBB5121303.1 hypothetical protein [Streptomyces eurocidicus]
MSGSPKYSTVTVAPAYARLEAQRRQAREAERRRLEARRAGERAERAARRAREAAARRERARAEAERRETESAERRAERQRAHAARSRQEQAGADARRLAEVRELLGRVRADGSEVRVLRQRLDALQGGVDRAEDLGGAIEELRGRVVLLGREGEAPGRGAGHGAVLAGLEERLAGIGPQARERDPQGYRTCVDLLGELRAAAGPGAETRFRALLGTVEHALARHAATAGERAAEERRRAEEAREAERRAEEHAAGREAARQAALEAERERLAAALAEAADRLGVVRRPVEEAAEEARELADPGLAERLTAALAAVTGSLAAGAAAEALRTVTALEESLVGAEARLDELQLACTRRMDLAQALRDAMLGEGFEFTGGAERDGRLLLSFERPSGATYETTVTTDEGGTPFLVYRVDGEPDITLRPEPDGAVCDRTEDLLERVHEAIVERNGFVPGELTWQGKPPGDGGAPGTDAAARRARRLPGAEDWRWSR